jgi:hypothetical protein
MRTLTHEEKILQNIQELSYCTECLLDFLDFALVESGSGWEHLCPRCYHRARERQANGISKQPGAAA